MDIHIIDYNLSMGRLRLPLAILIYLWIGFVLAALFVTQRPMALQIIPGLLYVSRAILLVTVLLVNAASLGGWSLSRFFPFLGGEERLLLGTGLGLGFFGLLGFGLAAAGVKSPFVYLLVQTGLLIAAAGSGWLRLVRQDASAFWQALKIAPERSLAWIPWLAAAALGLATLLAFAPPAESFDALMYHLAVPASWLKDGGLEISPIIPHYWFPGLVEGVFVWGLALGSEALASLSHLAWGILTVALIWWWARKVWSNSLAWRCVAVLISMPSLPLLASWAYTDLAMAFYSVAGLYSLWLSQALDEKRAWVLSGLFCGLAMGVKYTSFILPLVVIGWLFWRTRRQVAGMFAAGVKFSVPALLVASPWYLRNWIWVGNPFYPFLFGGKNWDSFLAAHFAPTGSGIGFNILKLVFIPLNLTIGQHDANYFDGRIGPFWLILLPVSLWVLWRNRRHPLRAAIYIPAIFGAVSLAAWILGVVNTASLWQSRLLFPALLPLAPLAALAWESFDRLDTRRLRFSFIFNTLVGLTIAITLLDLSFFVLARNPLAAALGMNDRQAYFERFQPAYADALSLVRQTPANAHIYFLFEPCSYGMNRAVTPDILHLNLSHDFYLYHTPENVLHNWQTRGFTYVLYQHLGDGSLENPGEDQRLFSMLDLVAETPNTVLFQIPSP